MKKMGMIKHSGVILLAVIMAIAYMPQFGIDPAYASDDEYVESEEVIDVLTDEQKKVEKDKAEAKAMAEAGVIDAQNSSDGVFDDEAMSENALPQTGVAESALDQTAESEPVLHQASAEQNESADIVDQRSISDALIGITPENGDQKLTDDSQDSGQLSLQGDLLPEPENLKINKIDVYTNGDVVMDAAVNEEGWTFSRLCMDEYDDTIWSVDIDGSTSFTKTFSLKDYDIGYHTLILRLCYNDQEVDDFYYWTHVKRPFYGEAPTIQYSDFTTGKNYFKYYNSGNYYSEDNSCNVCIEYKKGSSSWKTGLSSVSRYSTKKKSGLKAASTYKVRAKYFKKVKYGYDGKTYTFNSPVSKSLKIKTAYKKPKVKSVKISKVKVKKHKYKYWTGKIRQKWLVNARTGQKIRLIKQWKIYRTVKSYTTKYKVTVKFKKKQGVAGIQLHTSHGFTVLLNGDKKTYSKTFKVSGKKKGKKLKVSVKSRMSKKYDSWSGTYKKKVKIK